jgi:HAMP domain-containing protein
LASLDREFVRDHDEFAREDHEYPRRDDEYAREDHEFASKDDEFAPEDDKVTPDEYGQSGLEPQPRWLPSVWVLLGMAVAGVVLAFIWHNLKSNLSFASMSIPTTSTAAAPAPVEEVQALKKSVAELRDAQQQLLAKIAVLEVAQQRMQQELSAHSTLTWYSNSNILMYRTAAAHPPKPAPPSKPKPTPQSAPHSQDANASQPNRAPLPLGAGRP